MKRRLTKQKNRFPAVLTLSVAGLGLSFLPTNHWVTNTELGMASAAVGLVATSSVKLAEKVEFHFVFFLACERNELHESNPTSLQNILLRLI